MSVYSDDNDDSVLLINKVLFKTVIIIYFSWKTNYILQTTYTTKYTFDDRIFIPVLIVFLMI